MSKEEKVGKRRKKERTLHLPAGGQVGVKRLM